MALANTDTFQSITLGFSGTYGIISLILAITTDGTYHYINISFEDGGIVVSDGDDFDVLQEIWATDDRFLDSDDVMRLYLSLVVSNSEDHPQRVRKAWCI